MTYATKKKTGKKDEKKGGVGEIRVFLNFFSFLCCRKSTTNRSKVGIWKWGGAKRLLAVCIKPNDSQYQATIVKQFFFFPFTYKDLINSNNSMRGEVRKSGRRRQLPPSIKNVRKQVRKSIVTSNLHPRR
eukprot:TRINITY_DN4649_c1_g2_i1.p1 TRINITY_DN4649_c1_g2~~TRINITY_DN4649_c1_g2_i1.p1  ORF type:complete len:130 (-),score=3.70 TRINITY_DN4649_c1_g2_i1:1716-2105(-)